MTLFPEVNTQPSRKELVNFGLVLLVAAWVAAAYVWGRSNGRLAVWLAAGGAGMFLVTLVPTLGRVAYVGWMTLGVALGRVTSPIVLFVVYALLVVPVALAFRLRGRDTLRRRFDEAAGSYWEDYPHAEGIESYLRQS